MDSTIIQYPLDSMYFVEVIKDLLEVYNTVSIQKCINCYMLKVEGAKNKESEGE
jgi:hypothetical protein